MNNHKQKQKVAVSALLIFAFLFSSFSFLAQNVATSEDITGANVFIFRKPKPAQNKAVPRNNLRFQGSIKNDSRRVARQQAGSASSSQRKRTTPVDPSMIAQNKQPGKTGSNKPSTNGKPTPTPPQTNTMTDAERSVMLAGGGETLIDKKQYDEAIGFFEKAVELDPKNANARLGLSEAYARKGDDLTEKSKAAEAIKFYNLATKFNDRNTAALVGLASAYEAEENSDGAIKSYEQALAIDGKLNAVYEPLGSLYYQKSDWVNAEKYLNMAASGGSPSPDVQFYLGVSRYRQNRYEEAAANLRQALQANADSAETHYYLGEAYDKLDKYQEAIAEYKRATELNPDFFEAWFDLGVANFNRERYLEAAEAYKQAIRIKNDNGEAYANLADTYRLLGMKAKTVDERKDYFGKANGQYQIASVFIKNDAELYSNWGFSLGRVENWEGSVNRLNTAIQLNPVASDYSNLGWANLNWGEYDDKFKKDKVSAQAKFQTAKINLQKAVELNPKLSGAFVNLGFVLNNLGEWQAAATALETALSMRKDWWVLDNELGLAYRNLNNFANAVKYFKKTTEGNENFADGWYNLGEAQYRNGDVKEAKKSMDRVRRLDPNLANRLDLIIQGRMIEDPKNKIKNKVNEKNPLNKIPKLPY